MTSKEDIITAMCYTWRHDYGLRISEDERKDQIFLSGMTDSEARALYNQMKQIYHNCIEPYMEFKNAKSVD